MILHIPTVYAPLLAMLSDKISYCVWQQKTAIACLKPSTQIQLIFCTGVPCTGRDIPSGAAPIHRLIWCGTRLPQHFWHDREVLLQLLQQLAEYLRHPVLLIPCWLHNMMRDPLLRSRRSWKMSQLSFCHFTQAAEQQRKPSHMVQRALPMTFQDSKARSQMQQPLSSSCQNVSGDRQKRCGGTHAAHLLRCEVQRGVTLRDAVQKGTKRHLCLLAMPKACTVSISEFHLNCAIALHAATKPTSAARFFRLNGAQLHGNFLVPLSRGGIFAPTACSFRCSGKLSSHASVFHLPLLSWLWNSFGFL